MTGSAATAPAATPPGQGDIAFQERLYSDPNPTRRGLHLARRAWIEGQLASLVNPGTRVIEVGIGCGIFTRYLAGRGAVISAVDINPAFLAGVAALDNVSVLLADATHDQGFRGLDVALCSEVIEHVPRDRSTAMLRALCNALKPGGTLILTTPQRYATVELMARLFRFRIVLWLARKLYGSAEELGHINLLTAAQLRAQITEAGFTIAETARLGFYLPVIAEFGGAGGAALLRAIERLIVRVPVLRGLIWTQAYRLIRA